MYKKLLLLIFLLLNIYGCDQNKTNFSFEKITLHTEMCLGTCPIYHLEINNDKQIKLFVEEFYIEEYFEEKETIEDHCCDGSLKTISIYYNRKIKVIKTMFPSEKTRGIVSFLIDVCEKDQLVRTNEKFEI